MKLGDFIKSKRTEKGLSGRKLGLLSGLSENTVSMLERGERIDLRLSTAYRLSKLLGCSLEEMAEILESDVRDDGKRISGNKKET